MGFQVAICPGKPHVFFPLTFPSKSRRAYLPHHLFWHLQPQDSQKTLAHSSLHWDLQVAHTLARSWHRHRHRPAAGKYRMDVEGLSCQGQGCRIVFGIFLPQVLFFFPLSWYHLPCICNSLELEPVILNGICYILAWSLCILHGICYIWQCSPSILHGICHILAFEPFICMAFVTFWYFKRSCGSPEGSLGFHSGCHLRFHFGFHLGFYLGLHLGFHLGFL